jgi:hypothetical protein
MNRVMNQTAKLSFVEMRDGKRRLRWGLYFLGLASVMGATAVINGLLLAVGLWSDVDTVLFGVLVSVVAFNIIVMYQINRAEDASGRSPSPDPPPSGLRAKLRLWPDSRTRVSWPFTILGKPTGCSFF